MCLEASETALNPEEILDTEITLDDRPADPITLECKFTSDAGPVSKNLQITFV